VKNEIAQKDIACIRAVQREHKNFEENSIPKSVLVAGCTYL
jgi:hypothetical protein